MMLLHAAGTGDQIHGGVVPAMYEINEQPRTRKYHPQVSFISGYNPNRRQGLSPLETLRRILAESSHLATTGNISGAMLRMGGIIGDRPLAPRRLVTGSPQNGSKLNSKMFTQAGPIPAKRPSSRTA